MQQQITAEREKRAVIAKSEDENQRPARPGSDAHNFVPGNDDRDTRDGLSSSHIKSPTL